MKQAKTLIQVSRAVSQDPVHLEVDIKPTSFLHGLLQRCRLRPAKKVLVIRPVTLGTLIRISEHLVDIDVNIFETDNLAETTYRSIAKYGNTFANIVALAVSNSQQLPPPSLVEMILRNFDGRELFMATSIVIRQMDVKSFMTTIISIKGMNVLASEKSKELETKSEMSPSVPGIPSEGLSSTSGWITNTSFGELAT